MSRNYKIGDLGMVSKRPKMPIPSEAERRKIKASMGRRENEPFYHCRAKSNHKVREFEAAGDMSHSDIKHICDKCRCGRVAGAYTEHYGVGFCFDHENKIGASRRNNELIIESQKDAILQGYPDKVYKYESTDKYIDRVREAADKAGGMTDLREEMTLVRAKLQDLVNLFENGSRRSLTEGYDKEGVAREMTDATYYKLVGTMTTQLARLTSTNLAVTEKDYVHVDQVNIWFAQVIRILQQSLEADNKEVYDSIVDQIKLIPQMTKGRIK